MRPSGLADFFAAMQRLRVQAGEPSTREIARMSGQISHDTVHRTMTGPALPRWANVEAVVRALGGDPDTVKPLWLAASDPLGGLVAGGEHDSEAVRIRVAEPAAPDLAAVRSAMASVLDENSELRVDLPGPATTAPDDELPPPAEVRVVVVDEHPLFRFGLTKLLAETGFPVVGEAEDGAEALTVVADQRPDVVVVELSKEEIAQLVERDPSTRVLVVATRKDIGAIQNAMKAGAVGYLVKDAPLPDIVHAVRQAAAGIPVFTTEVANVMLAHYREGGPTPLSGRETEVLSLVARGLANRDIAQTLGISPRTVDVFLTRIRDKLGVRNRAGLVRYGIENNYAGE
jgi:DNA-binding NarL/FixJ family response regulator